MGMNPIAKSLRLAAKYTARNPSEARKAAGNYRKGKFAWQGFQIAIENPKGSKRSGTDANGKKWECILPATYGYIKGTTAIDSDHVDCYVGDDHESQKVWVIDQVDAKTGKYDEPKCMLSFPNKEAAVACYAKAFSDGKGKDRIGSVNEMPVAAFKQWVASPAAKKPLQKGYASGGAVGYAGGGILDDYYGAETHPLDADFERTLASYPPLRNFDPFRPPELRGTGPGESRNVYANPNTQEYLTPAYEGASPAVGGYGMGTAIGETTANLRDKNYGAAALAAIPLGIGALVPGPKGMPRVAREIDPRGFYSPSLEAAKALPQETGTVQQFTSMLLKGGAKPKELEATGFHKAFPDPQAKVSRGDIEQFLRENRVGLGRETPSGGKWLLEDGDDVQFFDTRAEALEYRTNYAPEARIRPNAGGEGERYESYSTPGGIPGSYREVVTTLPYEPKMPEADYIASYRRQFPTSRNTDAEVLQYRAEGHLLPEENNFKSTNPDVYTSSHWPGITNPLLHYRVKDFLSREGDAPTNVEKVTPAQQQGIREGETGQLAAKGQTESKTRVLDELQSDWAQRARDQGTRDPARIEELRRHIAEQTDKRDSMASLVARTAEELAPGSTDSADGLVVLRKMAVSNSDSPQGKRATEVLNQLRDVENSRMDLMGKLAAAERGVPTAPFVGNTSDWVDLGLKQALIDAARDPSVSRFAWAPGKVQADRYNLAHHVDALRWSPAANRLFYRPKGQDVWHPTSQVGSADELAGYIGKDTAGALLKAPGEEWKPSRGDPYPPKGLFPTLYLNEGHTIGGEGMKSFYGDMTPEGYQSGIIGTRLQKLVKGLDPEAARVEPHKIETHTKPAHPEYGEPLPEGTDEHFDTMHYPSIPITPKLRKEILEKGLPLFLAPLLYGINQYGEEESDDPVRQMLEEHYGEDSHPFAEGGAVQLAQTQSQPTPSDRLLNRDYQETLPPPVQRFEQSPEGADAYMKAFIAKKREFEAHGLSPDEARRRAYDDPFVMDLWRKSMQQK